MIPLAFVVAVALATLLVMIVAALSLARQARHMATTVARFRDEVEPVLREIRRDTERATERLERIREVREDDQPQGPGRVVPVDPDAPGGG